MSYVCLRQTYHSFSAQAMTLPWMNISAVGCSQGKNSSQKRVPVCFHSHCRLHHLLTYASGSSGLPEFNANAMAQLEGMGFPTIRCQKALLATGNSDPEAAMEWLFAHMEDPGTSSLRATRGSH